MARTKKTARKLYPEGQDKNAQGENVQEQNSQKVQANVPDKPSKKRVNYHVKSLREIRRAQKSVGLLIRRLPFMRVVKQISANLCSLMKTSSFVNVRWQTQALLCLQEAAEDFAIDFMNDAYLCAAHSHRVTLMAKDYVIVSRIIYKFDKALVPIDHHDKKFFDILNIPPARAPKTTVVIEEINAQVTHDHETRTAANSEEERKKQGLFTEESAILTQIQKLQKANKELLKKGDGQVIVNVAMPWQSELFLDIRPEDNKMLRELHLEISDSVVNISLRYI
ncbi:hypothetical protein KP509_07G005800 [Ceratopteris richardii]|uniref:Core Histone H2A/H2B/H3 domain-containing protein n=1 Tax=Ceratopteris richardii TaxID=49495 RepID=A0A8T2UDT9_CERRI|nr:hypothetical protein KP509_07G005800 [Ceratopteris richardii]